MQTTGRQQVRTLTTASWRGIIPQPSPTHGVAGAWIEINDIYGLAEALLCLNSASHNNNAATGQPSKCWHYTGSVVPYLKRHGDAKMVCGLSF